MLFTKRRRHLLAGILSSGLLITTFQNCSPGFKPMSMPSSGSNQSSSTNPGSNNPNASLDGKILYAQNCAGCHMDLSNSTKLNRTSAQIDNALDMIPQMQSIKLTTAQIDLISQALTYAAPPPTPTSIPTLPLGAVRVALNTNDLLKSDAYGVIPLRRLTQFELRNSLKDVFTIDPVSLMGQLPVDLIDESVNPFSNDTSLQSISLGLVESYESFAQSYAALFLSKASTINTLAGCTSTGVTDVACFNKFASRVGRLMFRRTITAAELTSYGTLLDRAKAENDYYLAPRLLIQFFVLHPEFLYRVESGVLNASTGKYELTNQEIASRLSYLIWGSAPDNTLMDAADAGQLKNETQRLAQADRMILDAKARSQWQKFHAQWLGYEDVTLPSNLKADMQQETNKLVDKVGFETPTPWMNLFSYTQSYLTPTLATHYGVPNVTAAGWVNYTGARGGGILAHGQFLAQGSKFGDTSPTLRGYRILKRVLCQKFGPVPVGVDPNNPPPGPAGACKTSTYSMRFQTSCTACHTLTDNIGFGLENYSPTGQWRNTEPNRPSCDISGEGSLGQDLFTGPVQLGDQLAKNPVAVQCASRQLLQFSLGRAANTAGDQATVEALHAQYLQTPQLKSMILALIKAPAFINR